MEPAESQQSPQHTTTWNPNDPYWGCSIIEHKLDDRKVTGYFSGLKQANSWFPSIKRHYPADCDKKNCECSYHGSSDNFSSDEEALLWLYSSHGLHWKNKTYLCKLPIKTLGNKRRKRQRLRDIARLLWDHADFQGRHTYPAYLRLPNTNRVKNEAE